MRRGRSTDGWLSAVSCGCGILAAAAGWARFAAGAGAAPFSWQEPQAEVVSAGDLKWAPRPFVFEKGATVRYIDFKGGSDAHDGRSQDKAWKHHPWDGSATGEAKAFRGPATFVFRRGVVYRGALRVALAAGTPAEPVRLTSDPAWGQGPTSAAGAGYAGASEAVICGAEPVRGWVRGGAAGMPEADRVWHADLPFAPRRVWLRAADGVLRRLTLARTPNWTESNPDDIRAEWWEWENPGWWTDALKITVGGSKCRLNIDGKHLTAGPETYRDALVWSEYYLMMGSPFASRVESFDPVRRAIAFQGPWFGDSEKIVTGNRYFLEDKPQFLDEPGEFWFAKTGDGGRLFVRLPGDADPNTAGVEAARHSTLLDLARAEHVQISGLVFQGGNTFWRLEARPFQDREVESFAIRLLGSGDDIRIDHCRFEHLTGGIRLRADQDADRIGAAMIADCEFLDLDRMAIDVSDSTRWGKVDPPFSSFEKIAILRNHAARIGLRGGRDGHGHAFCVQFVDEIEVAGNILERVGGSAIFVYGGKGSEQLREKPLSRVLIHHNKVVDPLLVSNDWGGIETWQGGPHYVWANVSINPGGYWHWNFLGSRGKDTGLDSWGSARQGYAFYFDGSFKNYVFNNIAAGKSNAVGSPLCNSGAFHSCVGFQNTYFNNTAYRFAVGVAQNDAARAGRDKWLGNVFEDMSEWQFRCGAPKGLDDGAAATGGTAADDSVYGTFVYGANIFHGVPRRFGVFEETGRPYATLAEFAAALKRRKAAVADVGRAVDAPLLAAPAVGDFRPAKDAVAIDGGVRVFVPWGLYGTVGEWNFTRSNRDPAEVMDEHWYMTAYHRKRDEYNRCPTFPLQAVGVTASDYVEGPLEDWTVGALKLNGRDQHLVLRHNEMTKPFNLDPSKTGALGEADSPAGRWFSGAALKSPDIHTSNLLIEAYLRIEPGQTSGTIAGKMSDTAGYALTLGPDGGTVFTLKAGGQACALGCASVVNDGKWHHLIAEADRGAKRLTVYLDGKRSAEGACELTPGSSLTNTVDFMAGRGLAATFDFLRLAQGTLADARTSIAELCAWEFDGPQSRDFCGVQRVAGKGNAGAIEGTP